MASAAELERRWGERVRANRLQVERLSEAEEESDFYAPTAQAFVEDPGRIDDPVLDAVLAIARPGETWLDIGAGAGRFALPLALRVAEVIAIDPSPAMRSALADGVRELGLSNVRVLAGRWPEDAAGLAADVALMAHVGYDIEEIGPFLAAAERAARRRCVAVMMDASPPAAAHRFWPEVHGEARAELPALPELLELLAARGVAPRVLELPRGERGWPSEEALRQWMRRQLWVRPGSPKDERLQALLDAAIEVDADGAHVAGGPRRIGVVDWTASPA